MRKMIRINDEETKILQALAATVPEKGLIVEIGSAFGWSCSKMAETSHESVTIVSIDPWTLIDDQQHKGFERKFQKRIKPFQNRIVPVRAFSQDVLIARPIDLLFIDGDHSSSAVENDYYRFSSCVEKGNLLVFHDYHEPELAPGVTKVIDDIVIPSDLWNWRVEYSLWIGERK